MGEKRGIAAVIYDNNGGLYFLIFHRVLDWQGWEFMKGEINQGERWNDTVLRLVVRETGLSKFKAHKKLDKTYEFITPEGDRCIYDVYLIETSMNIPVKISEEHDTYLWASFDSTIDKLEWPEQRKIFELAKEEIKKL